MSNVVKSENMVCLRSVSPQLAIACLLLPRFNLGFKMQQFREYGFEDLHLLSNQLKHASRIPISRVAMSGPHPPSRCAAFRPRLGKGPRHQHQLHNHQNPCSGSLCSFESRSQRSNSPVDGRTSREVPYDLHCSQMRGIWQRINGVVGRGIHQGGKAHD